jgi:hypothetical protein
MVKIRKRWEVLRAELVLQGNCRSTKTWTKIKKSKGEKCLIFFEWEFILIFM